MANIKSVEKRHRQSLKRHARNSYWRSSVKTAIKKARSAIAEKDPAKIQSAVVAAERLLKKAAGKGAIHGRNASRRIARLAKAAYSASRVRASA